MPFHFHGNQSELRHPAFNQSPARAFAPPPRANQRRAVTPGQTRERVTRPCFVLSSAARGRGDDDTCVGSGARSGFASSRHVEEVNKLPARKSKQEDLFTRGEERDTRRFFFLLQIHFITNIFFYIC